MRAPQIQLLVDRQGIALADLLAIIGRSGLPFRCVSALPLNGKPPSPQSAPVVIVDRQGMSACDPATGTVVGEPPLYVHRLLAATRTQSTRGL